MAGVELGNISNRRAIYSQNKNSTNRQHKVQLGDGQHRLKVCIIAEGSYPIVRGGVSEWTQQVIGALDFVDFDVFCLSPIGHEKAVYKTLPNLKRVAIRGVSRGDNLNDGSDLPKAISNELCNCLGGVMSGNAIDCERLVAILKRHRITKRWLLSREYWDYLVGYYQDHFPQNDFSEFFWTAQGIFSSVLDTLALVPEMFDADVYHSLTAGLGGLLGALAKQSFGRPLVLSEHGLYLKERDLDLSRQRISAAVKQQVNNYFKALVKTTYQYADYIMPICESYSNNELELGVPRDRIRVVSNGINANKFIPPPSKNGDMARVSCFARIVPVKDQITLIRASKKVLQNHAAEFLFIGEVQDREYYRECEELVKDLGLKNSVKFIGHVDNVVDWYQRSDVFVLSSQSEGVPLALLEAMSCGLPSVCTAVGGVPDILSNAGVGYLVPPGDPDTLASRISEVLGNKTKSIMMGMRARELVKENYTIDKMAQKILEVYVQSLVKEALFSGSTGR